MPSSVALVTCSSFPDGDPDDRDLLDPLRTAGIEATFITWDDPAVDWDRYALAVVRSTWDYVGRRVEFLAWADGVPRLANPAPLIRWSTDKRYLRDLAAAGVDVVPTAWVDDVDGAGPAVEQVATGGRFVVKPSVGAGSRDAGVYDPATAGQVDLAIGDARRLVAAGGVVMLQPYLDAVDALGETALVHVDGELSHAVTKAGLLDGPAGPVEGLFKPERIAPTTPTPAQRAVAERALAAIPAVDGEAGDPPLYARVDVVSDGTGRPVVLELELAEPSLFLAPAPGAAERFATAIARRALLACRSGAT